MNRNNGSDIQTLFSPDINHVFDAPDLLAAWQAIVQAHPHVNSLYASPAWVDHLLTTSTSRVQLVFSRDQCGQLTGIVPFRLRSYDLRFDVATTSLLRRKMIVAEILGSMPLLPKCP